MLADRVNQLQKCDSLPSLVSICKGALPCLTCACRQTRQVESTAIINGLDISTLFVSNFLSRKAEGLLQLLCATKTALRTA